MNVTAIVHIIKRKFTLSNKVVGCCPLRSTVLPTPICKKANKIFNMLVAPRLEDMLPRLAKPAAVTVACDGRVAIHVQHIKQAAKKPKTICCKHLRSDVSNSLVRSSLGMHWIVPSRSQACNFNLSLIATLPKLSVMVRLIPNSTKIVTRSMPSLTSEAAL